MEKALIRDLLEDYEIFARPVRVHSLPVVVSIDVIPILLEGLVSRCVIDVAGKS